MGFGGKVAQRLKAAAARMFQVNATLNPNLSSLAPATAAAGQTLESVIEPPQPESSQSGTSPFEMDIKVPKPHITYCGSLASDCAKFYYITSGSTDELSDAGFRHGDFVLLKFSGGKKRVSFPGVVLNCQWPRGVYRKEGEKWLTIPVSSAYIYTCIPPKWLPSGFAEWPDELTSILKKTLAIYPVPQDFSEPFQGAMQGGADDVTLDVRVKYRPPAKRTPDKDTIFERAIRKYPEGMRGYFSAQE